MDTQKESPRYSQNNPQKAPHLSPQKIQEKGRFNKEEQEQIDKALQGVRHNIKKNAASFFGFTEEELSRVPTGQKFVMINQARQKINTFRMNPQSIKIEGGELSPRARDYVVFKNFELLEERLDDIARFEQAVQEIVSSWGNLGYQIVGFTQEDLYSKTYEEKIKMLHKARENIQKMKENPQTITVGASVTLPEEFISRVKNKIIEMAEIYVKDLEKDIKANVYFQEFLKEAAKNFYSVLGFNPQEFKRFTIEQKKQALKEAREALSEAQRINLDRLNIKHWSESVELPKELEYSVRAKIFDSAHDYVEAFEGVVKEEEPVAEEARKRAERHAQEFISQHFTHEVLGGMGKAEKEKFMRKSIVEAAKRFSTDPIDFKTDQREWYFRDQALRLINEAYSKYL